MPEVLRLPDCFSHSEPPNSHAPGRRILKEAANSSAELPGKHARTPNSRAALLPTPRPLPIEHRRTLAGFHRSRIVPTNGDLGGTGLITRGFFTGPSRGSARIFSGWKKTSGEHNSSEGGPFRR